METPKLKLNIPHQQTKVVLHSCCAPCSSAIVECLMQNGIEPVIFYCNPNIYPLNEYQIRKDEITRYAQNLGLRIVDDDYNHNDWLCAMQGHENEPERGSRCLECFKYRLLRTAQFAHNEGIKLFTTTLASSRWKSLEQINTAGLFAASHFQSTEYWDQNWRKGGLSERRVEIIKQYDFYQQLYCGCEFSLQGVNQWRKQNGKPIINVKAD